MVNTSDFAFTRAKREWAKGAIDWDNDNIDVMLLMTTTTADTDKNAATISAIGTLGEFNGTNYAREDVTTRVVTEDTGAFLAKLDCDDIVFNDVNPQMGNGTAQIQALLIFKNAGGDASNIPLFYIDSFGAPFDPGTAKQTFSIAAGGLAQLL